MTVSASSRQGAIRDPALFPIADRVAAGERLSAADAVTLFESPDLLGVGALADAVNRAKHGDVVTFASNQHINPTNVCILRKTCVFCGYARLPREEGAYRYTLDQVLHGRQRRPDARVVRDAARRRQRDVEVDAHEDPTPLDGNVADGQNARHYRPRLAT